MWERAYSFIIGRLQESATWRGIALLAAVMGAKWSPEYQEAFVLGGLFISGLIGAIFPDKIGRQ